MVGLVELKVTGRPDEAVAEMLKTLVVIGFAHCPITRALVIVCGKPCAKAGDAMPARAAQPTISQVNQLLTALVTKILLRIEPSLK
jgi:hypothetical protein